MTLEVNKDGVYLTSMAHLNFARLAQRVCVNNNLKLYTVPHAYLGNKICERMIIEETYVEYLQNKIMVCDCTAYNCLY